MPARAEADVSEVGKVLWSRQGMTTKDSHESAASLEDLEGPELATPGMVWSFAVGLGLWGGVEPRPLLLRRSSLAPTHGSLLLQQLDSSSLARGPRSSLLCQERLKRESSSLSLSQKPLRRRLASPLMLTLEESLVS